MPLNHLDFKNKVIGKIKEKFDVKEIPRKHIHYEIWFKGQKVATTYCSHGSKEIYDPILSKIKKQLKLNNIQQLYELKNCPFTSEDYFNLLKEKNVISN